MRSGQGASFYASNVYERSPSLAPILPCYLVTLTGIFQLLTPNTQDTKHAFLLSSEDIPYIHLADFFHRATSSYSSTHSFLTSIQRTNRPPTSRHEVRKSHPQAKVDQSIQTPENKKRTERTQDIWQSRRDLGHSSNSCHYQKSPCQNSRNNA